MLPASLCAKIMVFRRITRIIEVVLNERAVLRSSMNEFYRKRIGRIVPPLIFWSVMLPVLYFVYLNYIATTDNPTIDMSTFTWQMTVTKICTFIFNFNYDTTPLWYLYMLITRVRDKDCVKNRVKRAKIVRFTLC